MIDNLPSIQLAILALTSGIAHCLLPFFGRPACVWSLVGMGCSMLQISCYHWQHLVVEGQELLADGLVAEHVWLVLCGMQFSCIMKAVAHRPAKPEMSSCACMPVKEAPVAQSHMFLSQKEWNLWV